MQVHRKILFLNPRAAKVFQDMAYDVAACWSPSVIWTEVSGVIHFHPDGNLSVQQIPRWACYNRTNYLTRLLSMVTYFFYVLAKVLYQSRQSLLFLVTTPPFLGLVGYLFKKIRRQKYVMLVYDIHPDALIGAGLIKDGVLAKIWRQFNRMVLNNADAVITIGEYMAAKLEKDFDVKKTSLGHIAVVHNWADVDDIKPLEENEDNPFVCEYGLQDKFIVMYSGNMGATHDMETLVAAARQLKDHPAVRFVIIGGGAKQPFVVQAKQKYGLENMLILPYLPQDQLRYSLPSADIAIVTIADGIEGCLVPCKFYACLAAGNALITVSNPACEIADIVKQEHCGKVIPLGDAAGLKEAIVHYYENPHSLAQAKANSRHAAVTKYSRKNTQLYIEAIETIYPSEKPEDAVYDEKDKK